MAKRAKDPKVEALRAERSLNPRPEAVVDEAFSSSEFFDRPRPGPGQVRDGAPGAGRRRAGESARRPRSGSPGPRSTRRPRPSTAAGCPALVPARPGPRRAHKLTDEVVAFAPGRRWRQDPSLRSADLAGDRRDRFGVWVHPRSIERALARRPKSRGRVSRRPASSDEELAERYEELRRRALAWTRRRLPARSWRAALATAWPPGCEAWDGHLPRPQPVRARRRSPARRRRRRGRPCSPPWRWPARRVTR